MKYNDNFAWDKRTGGLLIMSTEMDRMAINTIRLLAVDTVEKANSGHPGLPLGAAPLAYALWTKAMKHNPANPKWFNRDRFVLSAGHGSALLYAMLHLSGYGLPLEELKRFRQLGSLTPGHPEYGHTVGVEATTGPLGHGFAMGVGMAIAERMLSSRYNKQGFPIVDHYTYAIVSDGDLMEGVSSEAASLAGTLGLGKLIYLYDDNHISIEGSTDIAFQEDVGKRFEAYGWQVLHVADSEDLFTLSEAIKTAQGETDKPSIIMVRTHIGYGSPKADSASAHGEPLGAANVLATKQKLGWPDDAPAFYVPEKVRDAFAVLKQDGENREAVWNQLWTSYASAYPADAALLQEQVDGQFPKDWNKDLIDVFASVKSTSTREASGALLQVLSAHLPGLVGGSADLAPSNKTYVKDAGDFSADQPAGRNLHFGVREHAMGAIANGLALHGALIPYTGTFLVFSDFIRPAVRLSALMGLPIIHVFTHDSVVVGEDGPTHQPIEQTMSLRLIPGLNVYRPADALETALAWEQAIASKQPSTLLLNRQKMTVLHEYEASVKEGAPKGGYALSDKGSKIQVVIAASGSEVQLALSAQETLLAQGIGSRVVSLVCWEKFDAQSKDYRASVFPQSIPVIAVEAGVRCGWSRYTGNEEYVLGLDRFGTSAPGQEAYEALGFTTEAVVALAKKAIG